MAKRERVLSEDGFRYHLHAGVGEAGEAGHINSRKDQTQPSTFNFILYFSGFMAQHCAFS